MINPIQAMFLSFGTVIAGSLLGFWYGMIFVTSFLVATYLLSRTK